MWRGKSTFSSFAPGFISTGLCCGIWLLPLLLLLGGGGGGGGGGGHVFIKSCLELCAQLSLFGDREEGGGNKSCLVEGGRRLSGLSL